MKYIEHYILVFCFWSALSQTRAIGLWLRKSSQRTISVKVGQLFTQTRFLSLMAASTPWRQASLCLLKIHVWHEHKKLSMLRMKRIVTKVFYPRISGINIPILLVEASNNSQKYMSYLTLDSSWNYFDFGILSWSFWNVFVVLASWSGNLRLWSCFQQY